MHREFMLVLLRLETPQAQELLLQLIETLMFYLGELLKQLHISPVAKDIYRGVVKILVGLYHDCPQLLARNHIRLCSAIPPNCVQLHNMILTAGPSTFAKTPDPLQAGLKIDRVEDIRVPPPEGYDSETLLKQAGLLEFIDQALTGGPSEDAVAHIAHAIQPSNGKSAVGYLPIHANLTLIDAVVLHIAVLAIAKGIQKGGPLFIQGSTSSAVITMLPETTG